MRVCWLSPGDPQQRTGGYLYNRRVIEALRRLGHAVQVVVVDGPWPHAPSRDPWAGSAPDADVVVADGLLWTGIAGFASSWRARAVVLVHSPLGVEGGAALARAEAQALAGVRVVSTGGPTARDLARLGVGSTMIPPGTDPAPRARGPGRGALVALCTVTRRKRLPELLAALERVDASWTLQVAGALDRDPVELAAVRAAAARSAGRVTLLGELDDDGVAGLLVGADALVHFAAYEAWGMALSEAMARGLPVLSTPAGALEGGGGMVVADEAFAAALTAWLTDPAALQRASDAAWARAAALPTWDDTAAALARVLEAT
jgi:glycosyltransferase involved in cell wall biosynthesis